MKVFLNIHLIMYFYIHIYEKFPKFYEYIYIYQYIHKLLEDIILNE